MTENSKELKSIMDKKYDEYLLARDDYNKSLIANYQYLVGEYITYDGYLNLHVRKAFMSKDPNSGVWSIVLQGLGYHGDVTYYQDDTEFHWNWWTEVMIPERVYSDNRQFNDKIKIITKEDFRNTFNDIVNRMIEFNSEILDNKLDVETDEDD